MRDPSEEKLIQPPTNRTQGCATRLKFPIRGLIRSECVSPRTVLQKLKRSKASSLLFDDTSNTTLSSTNQEQDQQLAMATRITSTTSTVASLLVAQARSRPRATFTTTGRAQQTLCYSSLRRPARPLGSARGGRITARTTAPSRTGAILHKSSQIASEAAAPLAGAASNLDPHLLNTSQTSGQGQDANNGIVQGLDIAATPAVVPDDPFGVLQPYDTAAKLLTQPALIMTRQIEMMNGTYLKQSLHGSTTLIRSCLGLAPKKN